MKRVNLVQLNPMPKGHIPQPTPNQILSTSHPNLVDDILLGCNLRTHPPPPFLYGVRSQHSLGGQVITNGQFFVFLFLVGVLKDNLSLEIGRLILQDDTPVPGIEIFQQPQNGQKDCLVLELVLQQVIVSLVQSLNSLIDSLNLFPVQLSTLRFDLLNLNLFVSPLVVVDASPINSLLPQHQTHTVLDHVHQESIVLLRLATEYVVGLLSPADYPLKIIAQIVLLSVEKHLLREQKDLLQTVDLRLPKVQPERLLQ